MRSLLPTKLLLLIRVRYLPFQTAILLLRIDDIVSGSKKKSGDAGGAPAGRAPEPTEESMKE